MTFIQPSKCEICKEIPGGASANLLLQEDLPASVYKLDGIKEPPSSSCTYYIKCPICETHYEYHCDAHCMEYDIYVTRISPQKALKEKLIDKKRYNEIIGGLLSELNAKQDDKVADAARALADDYLQKGLCEKVIKLLQHKKDDVKKQTCYAISVANEDEGLDLNPYIDAMIPLLYDKGHQVADAADHIYHLHSSEKKSKNIPKYWENLMKAFSKHDMTYHSITILKKAVRDEAHLTNDMSPCIKNLIKFFTKKAKYDYLYRDAREVLMSYVRADKKNAKRFLSELKKFKGKRFISSLSEVEQTARIT